MVTKVAHPRPRVSARHTLGDRTTLQELAMSAPSSVFDRLHQHEQVVFCHDEPTGLRAIIAIHSTTLGPALGGTRFYPYADDQSALADVLELSRGMTYRAAAAGLDLGGGKA